MIPYSDWLEAAERLPVGRSMRTSHNCGEGKVLNIEHTKDGFRCWCFRCNEGGFKPHGQRALSKIIEQWNQAYADHNPFRMELPADLTDDMPFDATHWLASGGITHRLRSHYGIQYSHKYGRVFLPVRDSYPTGKLLFYQARAIHAEQVPKYLNPKVKQRPIFKSVPTSGFDRATTGVVTEDILSAIRIGEVRPITGISILGTSAGSQAIIELARYERLWIWLDPDGAGERGAAKLRKALQLVGSRVDVISPPFEPKHLTHRELQDYVWQHLT